MSRWAAHFLVLGTKAYRMYCLELDAEGKVRHYFPLTEEIAGTTFVEGILVAVPASPTFAQEEIRRLLPSGHLPDYPSLAAHFAGNLFPVPDIGEKVRLFQIRLHPLSASELRTDHRGSDSHIQ